MASDPSNPVMSDFNQRAYELFARPLVQPISSELTANTGRALHPCAPSAGRSPAADGDRLVALISCLLADERARARALTAEDRARVEAVLGVLGAVPAAATQR